jgi:hypothetical protein
MSDLYSRIVSQRGGLEKLLTHIPGYRGYAEMNARREADRLMREHVVRLLKGQMTRLIAVEKKMMNSGGLALVGQSRSAKTNFQIFIDKVNTAAPGYSGFYAAQKIGPEEMERIYAFDAALIEYVDRFKEAIDALDQAVTAREGIEEQIANLEMTATEANEAYALRDNLLTEIY